MLSLFPLEEAYWQRVYSRLVALSDPLPSVVRCPLNQVLDSEIHRIVTLWPIWLSPLLPLPSFIIERLSLATLCGAWAAAIRDACLDGELTQAAAPLARALWRRTWRLFGSLAVHYGLLLDLERRMVAAYRQELAVRTHTGSWQPPQLQSLTVHWVCARAAGWHVVQRAHIMLTGMKPDDPCAIALSAALDALILARQLRDDVHDLVDDVRTGRASWGVRLIAEAIWRAGGCPAPIDTQRIVGRWLIDPALRRELALIHAALCQQAMRALMPYAAHVPRLIDLVTMECEAGRTIATINLLHLPG
ncbi:MAG: hypothetical protein ACUVSL_11400 [Chloroflexus sp.]|uniref:hypothetical protein n=1 Tax=Chloroflexus sp. TaxID=1904827 RepID=UPI00404AC951